VLKTNRLLGWIWGGGVVLLLALAPWAPRLFGALPRCGLKLLFGIPCPACGSSRAALALARLDVAEAFAISPLAALAWILFLAGGLAALALAALGRRVPEPPRRLPAWSWWALGLAVLANWVYLMAHGR
jgi:Protein of unknown function (DUF2752)